jgi:hypothetical protein
VRETVSTVASIELTPDTRRRWRTTALVAAMVNLLLAVIEIGLAGGSGIAGVYIITVVLVINAIICFAFAKFLKS